VIAKNLKYFRENRLVNLSVADGNEDIPLPSPKLNWKGGFSRDEENPEDDECLVGSVRQAGSDGSCSAHHLIYKRADMCGDARINIGVSFNGRTAVSKTAYWGSSPCALAMVKNLIWFFIKNMI
jgi:hypothetical protein